MSINVSIKFPVTLFLLLLLLIPVAAAQYGQEYDFPIMEGESAEIQDGYYLNVIDVDTYNDITRFTVTYYGTVLLDSHYYTGDDFYFSDDYLILEFEVKDTYTLSYIDYVEISDVYISTDSGYVDDYNNGRPTDYTDDYGSNGSDEGAGVFLLLLILFLIVILMVRSRSKKKKAAKSGGSISGRNGSKKTGTSDAVAKPVISTPERNIIIKSAVQYKGATILYKIKVENNSSEPVGDIKVNLIVPDVFRLKEDEMAISMLQPGEGKTTTFDIRPTGECGNCIIAGKIRYYDYIQKKHVQFDLSNKMVDIVCPMLRISEIDETSWRMATSEMLIAEEDTKDLEIPAENLFDITTRILKDMNLYMITPEVTSTQQLYTGVARFYAEGVAGRKYAAYIEVVGKRKSRLIVKAWAEKEEALTGFYHKIIEDIEKRTDIDLFVDDSVSQYNITKTTIQDSVIQRSNIGSGKKKCPNCGREVEDKEKFCMNCGEKIE
ncbi:zinc-ribbon domain-containing protein [Methanolobus sp. ZRKC3]|uniref:zinc-ribbon domain-containing protein n=1 Tax=Methanolobus sp. ZRKC3 TaxID=3125786 RepID=UPI00325142F6